MNIQLTNLLSGYQDLRDRFGDDDPLVIAMKAEVDRRRGDARDRKLADRRQPGLRSGVFKRKQIPAAPGDPASVH